MALTPEGIEKRLDDLQRQVIEITAGNAVALELIVRLLDAKGALQEVDLIAELRVMQSRVGFPDWHGASYHVADQLLRLLTQMPRPELLRPPR